MPAISEQLAKSLHARGVKYVFGIPGGPSIPYLEAMRQEGIEFILVSNEQSAGMMADVCGRLTGVPGVCHATFGPGATNLATGVGGALLDRSPLLAFTTEVKDADLGRTVQMNIDHQALYRPITKWTTRMTRDNFAETMSKAYEIAVAAPPGPVHIGLPANIDGEFVASNAGTSITERNGMTAPNASILELAAKQIAKAKRPILAIGLTAVRLGLYTDLRCLIDKLKVPVFLTPMAKGIIPEVHHCYAGVLFHAQSDILAEIYRQADLVIGIGYDPVEFNYEAWMPSVPLIHIDTRPVDITPEYDVAYEIVGDLTQSIAYLNTVEYPRFYWDEAEILSNKAKLYQALNPASDYFTPTEAIVVLQEVLPSEGIITGDVGAHLHLLGQLWKTSAPQQFIMTNGWSSMGFGIPSAIGAKLCKPDRLVVGITGDGGFLMNCGEVLTARRMNLQVVFLVLCDRNLSLIEVKQGWKNVPAYGTQLYEGEYFASDHFLGVPVHTARSSEELRSALHKALSATGPSIIEAFVDGTVYQKLITRSYK